MKPDYYELKVELKAVNSGTGESVTSFGSMPIRGDLDLQGHIEMAGRAAAVQAYFFILIQGVRP